MAGPSTTSAEDIRKMGQLVKIKTNKKKYFVLRHETRSNSARLEYYDSEKKWRAGSLPKRTVVLRDCFNIHAKADAKHKHAIALYTKDDCFAVSCRSEDDQQEWLAVMIELRNRNLDENTVTRPLFEHVWPVTVKSKGLGGVERKVIPGQYRLCLTNNDLSLVPTNDDRDDIVLPLDCIRRCGHANQFFFLELGRQAITGSGNLWLQVEDMVISQNIHEALLSSMKKNSEVSGSDDPRIRSNSSIGGSTPSHALPKRTASTSNRRGGRSDGRVEEKPGKSSDCVKTNLATEPASVGHLDAGPKQTSEVVVAGSNGLKHSNPTLGDDGPGFGPEAHGSSSSVSSVISSVGSASAVGSSEHSIHSLSRLQEHDGGYIEMSIPQNLTEPSYDSVRPDAVPCYVRKDGTDERPKRAYSVGSKPLVTSSKPLNGSYIDMSGEPVATKDAEKSSSAPHLNDDDERKRELSDLFMELDFDRSNRDGGLGATTGFQERTSSGASPHGPQTKSATSFGARDVAAQKSSVFSRNKSTAGRPRTSTVCQEMLRPRTSSFGPSNLRPRSSSGGNVMSRQLQDGGRQSSRDSFQSHGRRVASQKNAKPGRSDSYLSMNLGKRSIDRLAESGDSGYMDMKLAEKKTGDSDYLKMTAGATGTTAVVVSASGENASARTSERIMMRQRLETVKAGSGDDYLEMAPESPSQSKVPGTTAVVQPKVKVTRSLGETASSYLQMAPRGASSDRTVRTNLETKDVHSPQKNDSYMEMSLGPGRHGKHSSASSLPQGAGTNSRAHTTCERARGSVVPASSSDRDGVRRSDREQNVSPHEDVPPPPFQLLMIPSQNFLLRADHTPPTIPAQPSASGTVVRRVAANSSVSPAVATFALDSLPGQTSYATLNPESLMGRHSTTPPAEGRRTGSIGRVRGLGRSSHQHIYAQIDFETSEECQK